MKILLVQMGYLGDTVLSTPVIKGIIELHPGAELWVMATPDACQIFEHDPLIAGVVPYKKRGRGSIINVFRIINVLKSHRFDRVYSLHRSHRTALVLRLAAIKERIGFKESGFSFLYTRRVNGMQKGHAVERNLSLLVEEGLVKPDRRLRISPAPFKEVLKKFPFLEGTARYVIMAPGSVWRTKRWRWEGYREAAINFLKFGYQVLIVGTEDEIPLNSMISKGLKVMDLSGLTTLPELFSLIEKASLVVCNDSMPLHAASALSAPSVAVFCSTSPELGFGPWLNRARVVQKEELSCKPCGRHGLSSCPTGTDACMKGVSSDEVVDAALKVMGI